MNTPTNTPKKKRRIFRNTLTFIVMATIVYVLFGEARSGVARWRAVVPVDPTVAEWPAYGGDAGGTRYSPIAQITPGNVVALEQAWVYRTGDDFTDTQYDGQAAFECTPLLVDGTLYVSTQTNKVIALDPETGEEKWRYDPEVPISERGFSEFTSRGVSAWKDATRNHPMRIFAATIDARLIALDAETGKPCHQFGTDGTVDLTEGIRLTTGQGNYQVTSPPVIVGDTVIVGSAIGDNQRTDSEQGVVRAYDAITGALKWNWDPIPRDETSAVWSEWKPEQAATTGAANAWSILSVDAERDLVFVPTGSASPDYYGGERLGDDRYANCVVALRASTGEVVWHFQVVHHDLWDYDVPAQPVLIDVTKDGETIPALVQATKMGHLFFLHRETGVPIFPVEERPVPQTDVEGEVSSPTQPFPVVTPPLVPQTITPDDAWGLTPIDKGWARDRIAAMGDGSIFTPPSIDGHIQVPGIAGGTNWGSVAFDPGRELVILNASRIPFIVRLVPRAEFDAIEGGLPNTERARQLGTPYGMHRGPLMSDLGLPQTKPPWGTIMAVSSRTGELVWESVLGTTRDLAPVPIALKTGTPNMGGPMVTAGGVTFISATMDYYLRAFDTATGEELWKGRLPAGGQATPMTYKLTETGRQYVVICAGGHGKMGTKLGDYVIAFALPEAKVAAAK